MTAARLWGLTAATMLAFAANSILNRAAVDGGHIDPLAFSVIRVLAGALMLAALVLVTRRPLRLFAMARLWGAATLSLYLLGFSIAYAHLDAGVGALILFGGVQVTMFAGAVIARDVVPPRRWIGAGLAMAGLAWLMWPTGGAAVPVMGAITMSAAALGWGLYSLAGRGAVDPLGATAANFIWAVPLVGLPVMMVPVAQGSVPATMVGVMLAVLSGAVTSGLGYALWYDILPRLGASLAGLVQLSVPVIAVAGGLFLLGEGVSARMIGAGLLVLGGIAYGIGVQRTTGSSAS